MKEKRLLGLVLIAMFFPQWAFATGTSTPLQKAWSALMSEYRIILAYIAGFGALTSILTFIVHFMRLGAAADNPQERQKIVRGMLISAICTALLGGVTLLLTLLYSIVFLD
ncbi:UNVERIFIED_ORG: hypothetical protein BDK47_11859 [Anoxybacillus amylolyticus]